MHIQRVPLLFAITTFVLHVMFAPAVRAQQGAWQLNKGTAEFAAQYTFGSFRGTTSAMRGSVSGTSLVTAQGSVVVMLDSLVTGNGSRDNHMREALETTAHPTARFVTDSIRLLNPAIQDSATLFGTFTVRGESRPVVARARVIYVPANGSQSGVWQIGTSFPVTLAEHGISKGISRFLGSVRVGPVVQVSISAEFKPANEVRQQ